MCCILLGERKLLKWYDALCVLYSPRGDEIAQMVGAHVCCILLGETRLLKWQVPMCVLYSPRGDFSNGMCPCVLYSPRGEQDCSNGMCPCVLYSPRGDEIAQMACARVCCILLGESRLLKWHVPVCAVFS